MHKRVEYVDGGSSAIAAVECAVRLVTPESIAFVLAL